MEIAPRSRCRDASETLLYPLKNDTNPAAITNAIHISTRYGDKLYSWFGKTANGE